MLQEYRIPFCAFMFALAAFFFAPLTASAAPQCPDTMPNRWCDNFTAKCDSGNKWMKLGKRWKKPCDELNRRSRAVNRMQATCDKKKGRGRACWILKKLYSRKASMDKNYTPPVAAAPREQPYSPVSGWGLTQVGQAAQTQEAGRVASAAAKDARTAAGEASATVTPANQALDPDVTAAATSAASLATAAAEAAEAAAREASRTAHDALGNRVAAQSDAVNEAARKAGHTARRVAGDADAAAKDAKSAAAAARDLVAQGCINDLGGTQPESVAASLAAILADLNSTDISDYMLCSADNNPDAVHIEQISNGDGTTRDGPDTGDCMTSLSSFRSAATDVIGSIVSTNAQLAEHVTTARPKITDLNDKLNLLATRLCATGNPIDAGPNAFCRSEPTGSGSSRRYTTSPGLEYTFDLLTFTGRGGPPNYRQHSTTARATEYDEDRNQGIIHIRCNRDCRSQHTMLRRQALWLYDTSQRPVPAGPIVTLIDELDFGNPEGAFKTECRSQ
ncbi:hypothetical protein M1N16_09080 [Nitrospinaceae bacterium]|nr:hypothetical protein [Nitrospinaceae bacterium]